MLNHIFKSVSILLLVLSFLPPDTLAQVTSEDVGTEKLAQTGFKFLKISTDARAAALAGAVTASELNSATAMFYNPAGMARMEKQVGAGFGYTQWIADFNYSAASAAYNTEGYGVIGVALMFADYGDDFIGTVRATNEQGYLEYSELGLSDPKPTAMSIGLGYAKAVTDRFSVGANAKYVMQDLGDVLVSDGVEESNDLSTVAFDFGVLYRTGFESLNLAMTVRNFARELKFVDENFELPLTFNVGVSMNVLDLADMDASSSALLLSVEAERPRDFSEQLKIGAEYSFSEIFYVRGGYLFPTDEEGVSFGAGLRYDLSGVGFGLDYSYTTFGVFGEVQRFGVQLAF